MKTLGTEQKIKNLADLKAEIGRLTIRKVEQEAYLSDQYRLLKHKVQGPARFVSAVTSYVPGGGIFKGMLSSIGQTTAERNKDSDWLTKTLRIAAPFVLNSTFLRNSGWMKKALILLASESAVGQVNTDKVSGFINKVTNFVKPKGKKKKKDVITADILEDESPDFGIPPNSETY